MSEISHLARLGRGLTKKRICHTPEQLIRKPKIAEQLLAQGKTVADVCRALEVAQLTYHRWRQLYGGMQVEQAKWLPQLVKVNSRLKKLMAEFYLQKATVKELAEGNFLDRSGAAGLLWPCWPVSGF